MSPSVKRLRILAGPNGSGKTSVYKEQLKTGYPNFGIFVNADDIEQALKISGIISFQDYDIKVNDKDLKMAFNLFKEVQPSVVEEKQLAVRDNFLVVSDKEKIDSYFAAFIAGYIRDRMLESGVMTITIETVMSHPSKLEVMRKARDLGYRVYLYYVTTSDPTINIERVKARTKKGGHGVSEDKIRSRYYRSLDNLFEAVTLCDRAFLVDNSGKNHDLVAEYIGEEQTLQMYSMFCPEWVDKYIFEKINNQQ